MKFVAVTSCPTGIAHTYMAAENLEQSGKDAGHEVQVETQGSAGSGPAVRRRHRGRRRRHLRRRPRGRGKDRFAGKPFVDVGVKKAVHDAPGVIAAAVAAVENAPRRGTLEHIDPPATRSRRRARARRRGPGTQGEVWSGVGTRVRQWLMTGVSYMIPFVAAGGILIALGFLFGGDEIVDKLYGGASEGDLRDCRQPAGFPARGFDASWRRTGSPACCS